MLQETGINIVLFYFDDVLQDGNVSVVSGQAPVLVDPVILVDVHRGLWQGNRMIIGWWIEHRNSPSRRRDGGRRVLDWCWSDTGAGRN